VAPAAAPAPLAGVLGRYLTTSTPLAPPGGPGQYLPVELRLGSVDKASFVRVSGSGTVLDLALSATPGHQVPATGTIVIAACSILDGTWDLTDGGPMSTAPRIDGSACAVGAATETGYRFDVSRISTANGLALVPSGPTTSTGRVTFLGVPA
jgi:hypothetical protein